MLEKRPYLSQKALRYYLFSTILSTMSTYLGVIIDGIIVGQIMGVKALTAISLCSPLLQFITTIMLLLTTGNMLLISNSMGRGAEHETKQYFSFTLVLNAIFSIIFVVLGLFFSEQVSRLLTDQADLLPMVKSYTRIVLLSGPVYLFLPALSFLVRTVGAPRLSTMAMVVTNVINLSLTYIFIKYLDLGVAGSSLATTCSYFVGVVLLIFYVARYSKSLSFVLRLPDIDKIKAIKLALPIALSSLFSTINILGINYLVSTHIGIIGLGQVAVISYLMMVVSMFIGGIVQSIQPVSGFMIGQKDYHGFSYVSQNGLKILMIIIGIIVVLVNIFPQAILAAVGYENSELIAQTSVIVQIVSLSFMLNAVNYLLMMVYLIGGHLKFSLYISVMQPLAILPIMLICLLYSPELVWWSYLIGEAVVLAPCIVYACYSRLKDSSVNLLTIQAIKESPKALEVSISNGTTDDFSEFIVLLDNFCQEHEVKTQTKYHLELCCEELLSNVIRHAYTNDKRHYIDINVSLEGQKASISIKDNGISFDPLNQYDQKKIGLTIVRGICNDIKYQRLSGQNMIFLKL